MPKIFISYRRADSRKDAGRIYDRMVDAFGKDNIFKDVDDIPFGDDFRGVLSNAVNGCDIVLAIIGKVWLGIKDMDGNRRLDNPTDFVRIEIRTGLQREEGCLVVPVLVDSANMPSADDLPNDLRELVFKNAITVRDDPDFHNDVTRLIRGLQGRYGSFSSSGTGVTLENIQSAIGRFYTLFDEGKWEEARALLAEIRASGKSPRVFNIDVHEKQIWEAIEAQERDREYDVLRLMAARPKPVGIWEALEKFWESFPNYDPDNLARFRPSNWQEIFSEAPSELEFGMQPSTLVSDNPTSWLENLAREQEAANRWPKDSNDEVTEEEIAAQLTPNILKILPPPFDWCFIHGGNVALETDSPNTYNIYTISDFAISKYVITNAQYQVFIESRDGYMYEDHYYWYNFSAEARDYRSKRPRPAATAFKGDDLPRTNLSWYDAVAFSRWLSHRSGLSISLPSEQQWQRAAVGDTGWRYPWGNKFDPERCNSEEGGLKKPVSVTEYPNGASPYGVYNMSGNVWELCLTDYDNPNDTDIAINVRYRVLRGGSWHSNLSTSAHAYRYGNAPYFGLNNSGLRLALSIPTS